MPKVKLPILIIQGDLDRQVFPHHADKLAELGRARKNAPPVQVVHLPGINHLLTPAETGEVSESGALPVKTITPAVAKAIVDWLKK
jgi:pimeloyl-ACP methyl ester carboxylesterase